MPLRPASDPSAADIARPARDPRPAGAAGGAWRALAGIALAAGLAMGAALGTPAGAAGAPVTAAAELERAAEADYLEGDFAGAAAIYRRLAAAEGAEGGRAWITAAWLDHLGGDPESAREALAAAFAIEPHLDLAADLYEPRFLEIATLARADAERRRAAAAGELLARATAELDRGDLAAARGSLQSALELEPGHPVALYDLGLAELAAGDFAAASRSFAAALGAATEPGDRALVARIHHGEAVARFRDGEFGAARDAAARAIEADPDNAAAWRLLARSEELVGAAAAALAARGRASLLEPEAVDAPEDLARALGTAGHGELGVALLHQAIERQPHRSVLHLELGRLEAAAGRQPAAAAALSRAWQLAPGGPEGTAAADSLAQLLLARRPAEAAVWAERAAAAGPEDAARWRLLARARRAAGDADGSRQALATAFDRAPSDLDLALELGDAHAAAGDGAAAARVFAAALALDPASEAARTRLAAARAAASPPTAEPKSAPARPRRPLKRKRLGVEFADLDYGKLALRGALVKKVAKRSPAARAGLRRGDLILRLEETPILDPKDFKRQLASLETGDQLTLEVLRDGIPRRVTLLAR